jgi:hypothetical protein
MDAHTIFAHSFFGRLSEVRPAVTPEISISNIPLNLPAQKIGANDLIFVSVYD